MNDLKTVPGDVGDHAVVEQVRLILQARGIEYHVSPSHEIHIDYGSARVEVAFRSAAGETIIRVLALVLDELEIDDEVEFRILRSLNDRNRTLPFGKFVLDRERAEVQVEYEILGDHLQDPEFMTALTAVAGLADDHDDLLQSEFGTGRRAADRHGRGEAVRIF